MCFHLSNFNTVDLNNSYFSVCTNISNSIFIYGYVNAAQ